MDFASVSILLSAGGDARLIEILLGLLVVVAAVSVLAVRLKIPYPVLLVIVGMVIAIIPGLPVIELGPEYVFLLFLPPLLYYSGVHTTWRDFVQNRRPILLLAVGLVALTTVAVAYAARLLIPGISWPAAIALGAIVSPPDAIAAAAIAQRLIVPKRIVTILEGESLVNDATALVLYKLAIFAVAKDSFPVSELVWKVPLVAAGGIAIGLVAAWCALWLRQRISMPSVEGTIALLTPFFAYIPAEWAHCSGVLAAVAAGVYMSRQSPRMLTSRARLRDAAVWEMIVFILNGLIFILIGLQLPAIIESLSHVRAATLLWWAVVISAVTIMVRMLWVYPMAFLPRVIIPAIKRTDPMPPASWLTVIGWAGMRGIVTLAAAMALPKDFPYRNEIVFLSFAVIFATLVLQGLTLPPLIRFLKLGADDTAVIEERQARLDATHAALARLETMAFTEEVPPEVSRRIRESYDERLASLLRMHDLPADSDIQCPLETLRRVHHEVLVAERKMVTMMRDQNIIGDEVLRRLVEEIDLEETKLID